MIKLTELAQDTVRDSINKEDYIEITKEILKSFGLGFVKIKIGSKGQDGAYATYNFDTKTIMVYLKSIKTFSGFLLTLLHEIYHALDHKKLGDKFIDQYELAMARAVRDNKPDWFNKYEIKAEKFAKQNFRKWYNKYF